MVSVVDDRSRSASLHPIAEEMSDEASIATDELFRVSTDQFRQMVETGIFDETDRVELLEGMLLRRMTSLPAHSRLVSKLNRRLQRNVPTTWWVRQEQPLRLPAQAGQPEPDIAIVRGDIDSFDDHPSASDAVVVMEVSDTTLRRDRRKGRSYAAAGIPVYLIVDVQGKRLIAHRTPGDGEYKDVEEVTSFDITLDGTVYDTITRAELFG